MSQSTPDHSAEPPAASTGIPLLPPAMAVIEILLLVALPAALDYSMPAFPKLTEIQPHPFWLPVLLLSLQYGTVSGLLAAGVAIAASAMLGWPEQEIGENHFSYLLRICAQPVLWLAVALVLGQFRNRQIERKMELARHLAEMSSQRVALSEYATNLRVRCDQLERAFAVRRAPVAQAALASLGRLPAAAPADLEGALAATLAAAFGSCEASVLVLAGDELQTALRLNWKPGTARQAAFTPADALWRPLIEERRSLSVLVPGDERELSGHALAAVPIETPEGAITGVLKLESLPPAQLDPVTLPALAAIAGVLSTVVGAHKLAGAGDRSATATPARPAAYAESRRAWRHLRRRGPSGGGGNAGRLGKTGTQ